MSIISLIKRYISLKIDQLETKHRREEELIETILNFLSPTNIEKIFNIIDFGYTKNDKPTIIGNAGTPNESNGEIDIITKEIAYNMEKRPIPYLIEMLDTDICNTMQERYGNKEHNCNHPIEWSPNIYDLPKDTVKDIIKLLGSSSKDEIIVLINKITNDDKVNTKVLRFYHTIETKASNKIIATLMNIIADEKLGK